MNQNSCVISVRLDSKVRESLDREAARRNVCRSTLAAQFIEQEISSSDNYRLDLLRSVLVIRELVVDMSTRSKDEKEHLRSSMTENATEVLGLQNSE